MNSKEFIKETRNVVNYITDYIDNLSERNVNTDVCPGYLSKILPPVMPEKGENFPVILKDIEDKIMPGIVHWAHPHFHGYLPSSHAYPSILADMFAGALGAMSFSWIAGPALVELEIAMTDWLGRALGLPHVFLNGEFISGGGGVMASSATECTLLTLLAARLQTINHITSNPVNKLNEDSTILHKLVAYCSEEAHSCIEKAAKVAMVQLRVLKTNSKFQLEPETLNIAMRKDIAEGLQPCYVVVTLGTSCSGAFDNLKEIAPIVKSIPGCWLHVNAAYGGNKFICPEFRSHLVGIDQADSFCVNPYKGLLINIDSTCLWVRDRVTYCSALIVDPIYLTYNAKNQFLDHRHWSLWLSRRFRSLKIWYTFRLYGVEGLQTHVRKMMQMAQAFARLVRLDTRFELCNEVLTPLVCFRLNGTDELNHELLAAVNGNGKVFMTPAMLHARFTLRFVVGHENTNEQVIEEAWTEINKFADLLLSGNYWGQNAETRFRRLSFTRRASFMDYRHHHPKALLKDTENPVLIPNHALMEDEEEFSEYTHL